MPDTVNEAAFIWAEWRHSDNQHWITAFRRVSEYRSADSSHSMYGYWLKSWRGLNQDAPRCLLSGVVQLIDKPCSIDQDLEKSFILSRRRVQKLSCSKAQVIYVVFEDEADELHRLDVEMRAVALVAGLIVICHRAPNCGLAQFRPRVQGGNSPPRQFPRVQSPFAKNHTQNVIIYWSMVRRHQF